MPPLPNSALPTPNSPPSPGRPRSLDESKQDQIAALVATGAGLAAAARYVGCNITTIRREARRNPEFADLLRAAQQKAELDPLRAIRSAARKSWRAGVYLLERADAERHTAKNARRLNIAQLRKYNAALVGIVKFELRDRMLCHRLSRLFNEALDHSVRQIAAGRDPFPLPPEIARADFFLPPATTPNSSFPIPNSPPPAPQQPTPPQPKQRPQMTPPNDLGISYLIQPPHLHTPPNEQHR